VTVGNLSAWAHHPGELPGSQADHARRWRVWVCTAGTKVYLHRSGGWWILACFMLIGRQCNIQNKLGKALCTFVCALLHPEVMPVTARAGSTRHSRSVPTVEPYMMLLPTSPCGLAYLFTLQSGLAAYVLLPIESSGHTNCVARPCTPAAARSLPFRQLRSFL
jgi:hypothetical protein